jgi:gas vesicle protein
LGCFLAGLGIGAVVALIFAPQSGEETRKYIATRADEGREFLTGKSRQVRQQAGEFAGKSKELLNKGKERFAEAVETGKQTYHATLGR